MDAVVNGIPLIVAILGLVEFAKRLGVKEKGSLILSMCLGLVLGILYQLSLVMPANLSGWLSAVVYGLALGLAASGLYDYSKQFRSTPQ
ncbi:MAG: hypothetical protein C4575_12830 [Desulforudis sp.]|jgi:drug/metabolite transporter (DMT)-like permease|nr:MAG: hypothetical protein C4575_12830 [Desulforudis sp.]